MSNTTPIVLWEERQRFTEWWMWLSILIADIALIVVGYQSSSKSWSIFLVVLITAQVVFFALLQLHTKVTDQGVYVRFLPFSRRYGFYAWHDIESATVRKYNPIKEYGGWGLRYGGKKNGRALNVSGNMGLQLVLKNGKRLLIGTKQDAALQQLLAQLAQQNKIAAIS